MYQKKRFYQIHRDLANFYYVNLKRNEQAKNYVSSRGIDQNIRKDFGIGFAPNAWRAGIGFLTERGHTIDDMIACGVAIRNDRGDIYCDDKFLCNGSYHVAGEFDAIDKVIEYMGEIVFKQQGHPKI